VKGFGPAPQIPPLRLLGGIDGRAGAIDGRLEVEHSFAQNRNAPVETETDGFTLVNASLNWRPLQNRPQLTLGLQANNLFDVEARRHTSLLNSVSLNRAPPIVRIKGRSAGDRLQLADPRLEVGQLDPVGPGGGGDRLVGLGPPARQLQLADFQPAGPGAEANRPATSSPARRSAPVSAITDRSVIMPSPCEAPRSRGQARRSGCC
jgi:hypothetical protein